MARINIEDSVFTSNSYADLCIAAGSRITAVGALACLWIEAQKHYLTLGEIPTKDWLKSNLPEYLIQTGWAERTSTGVRARGQDDQFKWLRQAQSAGEASAASRKSKANGGQPPSTPVRENTQRPSTASQPLTPTLPPSPPLSLTPTSEELLAEDAIASPSATDAKGQPVEVTIDEDLFGPEPKPIHKPKKSGKAKAGEGDPTLGSRIFKAYADEYRLVHGDDPVRDRAANSLCKAIGETLGEEGIEIAKFYVRHPKAFYVQAYHPLTLFKQDAPALRTQFRTGKIMTSTQAREKETKQQNYNAFSKHMKKEPQNG